MDIEMDLEPLVAIVEMVAPEREGSHILHKMIRYIGRGNIERHPPRIRVDWSPEMVITTLLEAGVKVDREAIALAKSADFELSEACCALLARSPA